MNNRIASGTLYQNASLRISGGQYQLFNIQNQLSTGKRINVPSDDPVGAAALSIAKDKIELNKTFTQASDTAQSKIDVAASKTQGMVDILQRVRELAVNANSSALTAADRAMLGKEVSRLAEELAAQANAQDGLGNYIFSGSRTSVAPFSLSAQGYNYMGDQTDSFAKTSAMEITQTGWNGFRLLSGSFSGDGAVNAVAASGNTGGAFVSKVAENSFGSFDGGVYQIDVSVDAAGAKQVSVTDTATATVLSGPVPYVEGMSIAVGGASVELKGSPEAGDSFEVAPAERENVLNVVRELGLFLEQAGAQSTSGFKNGINGFSRSLDNAMNNMLSSLALMGAESNSLTFKKEILGSDLLALETERSKLEDLDYAKAITDLQRQQTSLEASMQSFQRISSLSLFNFLR